MTPHIRDSGTDVQCVSMWVNIPDNDDDKIEQVPAAADVGAGVHDQAVGQDLSEGLDGEDDQEDILYLFLCTEGEEGVFRQTVLYFPR